MKNINFKYKCGYILKIAEIGLGIQRIFFSCEVFYMSHGSVIIGAESMYIKLRLIFKNRIH